MVRRWLKADEDEYLAASRAGKFPGFRRRHVVERWGFHEASRIQVLGSSVVVSRIGVSEMDSRENYRFLLNGDEVEGRLLRSGFIPYHLPETDPGSLHEFRALPRRTLRKLDLPSWVDGFVDTFGLVLSPSRRVACFVLWREDPRYADSGCFVGKEKKYPVVLRVPPGTSIGPEEFPREIEVLEKPWSAKRGVRSLHPIIGDRFVVHVEARQPAGARLLDLEKSPNEWDELPGTEGVLGCADLGDGRQVLVSRAEGPMEILDLLGQSPPIEVPVPEPSPQALVTDYARGLIFGSHEPHQLDVWSLEELRSLSP